jgi:hypothetical protein
MSLIRRLGAMSVDEEGDPFTRLTLTSVPPSPPLYALY